METSSVVAETPSVSVEVASISVGEFECFSGDLLRCLEDIGGLRGEFERRRGDLER